MTSSEDNRVSIPPKRSEIGLSVSRSCDSSQLLAFVSVIFYRFFSWSETGTYERVTIVNLLFRSTGSLVSAAESMLRPG